MSKKTRALGFDSRKPQITIKIKPSEITSKYVCCLSIPGVCKDQVITVWNTFARAKFGKNNLQKVLENYSISEIKKKSTWMEILSKLENDDDEILGIIQMNNDGSATLDAQRSACINAMKEINEEVEKANCSPLFQNIDE